MYVPVCWVIAQLIIRSQNHKTLEPEGNSGFTNSSFITSLLGRLKPGKGEKGRTGGFEAGLGLEFRSSQGHIPCILPTLGTTASLLLLLCLNFDKVKALSLGAFGWKEREEPVWTCTAGSTCI